MTIKEISEKTRISLGTAVSILVAVVTVVIWGVVLESRVAAHVAVDDKREERTEARLDRESAVLYEIRDRVIRIEERLPPKGH